MVMLALVVPLSGMVPGLNDFDGDKGGFPTISAGAPLLMRSLPPGQAVIPVTALAQPVAWLLCGVPFTGGVGIALSARTRTLMEQLLTSCPIRALSSASV